MNLFARGLVKANIAIFAIFVTIGTCTGVSDKTQKIETCTTSACESSAALIKKYMNTSVNPCDDFYEFVCGNIKNSVIIRDGYTRNSSFSMIYDNVQEQLRTSFESDYTEEKDPEAFLKLKSYYNLCMDDDLREKNGEAEFHSILKELGGWPLIDGKSWDNVDFDWIQMMYKLNEKGFISGSFFDTGVASDMIDNSRRLIWVTYPGLGLSREYLTRASEAKIRTAYLKYMVDVIEMLGADRTRALKELTEVLMFNIKLAKISLDMEEQRNISNLYNPMTVAELERRYPYIPWLSYMNNIYQPYQTVKPTDVIILAGPKYFDNLNQLLTQTPKRVKANYIYWRVVLQAMSTLSKRIKKASEQLSLAVNGKILRVPKWVKCVADTSAQFSLATGALYVRQHFDESKKDSVRKIIDDVTDSFRNVLKQVDWMDAETKKSALDKLDNMAPLVAYPNELMSDEKLNDYYKSLRVDSNSSLRTELNINRFAFAGNLRLLNEKADRFDWRGLFGAASTVNAFYDPTVNAIEFPSGILQHPFFNAGNQRYSNYAGVGFIVGHEMTHGFDDTGRQFDKDGHFLDWWQSETKKKFLNKAKCIIDQYSNYTVKEVGLKLNGLITQGENIADNGGIKMSYKAYDAWRKANPEEPRLPGLEDYTPKQLFWISFAHAWCTKELPSATKNSILTDVHSVANYRVIGPLSNRPEFAEDFNCPSGTFMNPVNKCSVW